MNKLFLILLLCFLLPNKASAQHTVVIEDRHEANYILGAGIVLFVGGYFGGIGTNTRLAQSTTTADNIHTISNLSLIPIVGNWIALPYMDAIGYAYSPIIFGSLQLVGLVMTLVGIIHPPTQRQVYIIPNGIQMRW